ELKVIEIKDFHLRSLSALGYRRGHPPPRLGGAYTALPRPENPASHRGNVVAVTGRRYRGGQAISERESTMTTEWRIKGTELANCNCAYGCPCQFNALPTHGDCRAAVGFEIEEGHFGDVRIAGLRTALLLSSPGAVHEGNGTMRVIIAERGGATARDVVRKI